MNGIVTVSKYPMNVAYLLLFFLHHLDAEKKEEELRSKLSLKKKCLV